MYRDLRIGIIWGAIGQYGRILVLIIINMFLSRLLSPSEYGQVAMITVFITFFQLMTEAGLGPAIVQQRNFQQKDYANLFNISLIFSFVFAILFGLFGFVIALFYGNAIYIKFAWLLSIVVFFSGVQIVPNAVLLKNKQFKSINIINLCVTTICGLFGIFFAVSGLGVYTLIYNSILSAIFTSFFIYKKSEVKLIRTFDLDPMKKIWNFSRNQFGFNFINYFSRNSDSLLIGKFFNSDALGNYNKSYQLLMYPVTIFGGIVTPVLQPVLAKYQDNPKIITEFYFQLVKILATLTVPFSVFLMFSSKQIILLMFGDQWSEAVRPFSILSATVWIQVISSTAGAIFQSRNKSKELLVTGILSSIILVTSILIGVILGTIESVAICLTFAFVINFIQSYWFLTQRVLNEKLIDFLKIFYLPFIFGVIMTITFSLYNQFFDVVFQSVFINMMVRGFIFLIIFLVCLFVSGLYKEFIEIFVRKDI